MSRLQKTFPKSSGFIKTVLGGISNILIKFVNILKSIISGTWTVVKKVTGGSSKLGVGVRTGLSTGAMVYGMDKMGGSKGEDLNKTLMSTNTQIKADYTNVEF
jgi:hypothetical protein